MLATRLISHLWRFSVDRRRLTLSAHAHAISAAAAFSARFDFLADETGVAVPTPADCADSVERRPSGDDARFFWSWYRWNCALSSGAQPTAEARQVGAADEFSLFADFGAARDRRRPWP